MVCKVNPREEKELKKIIDNRFPLIFVKTYEDLKNKIDEKSYVVLSLSNAKTDFEQIQSLTRSFPNIIFNFYQQDKNDTFTDFEDSLMNEPNITDGQYNATELVANYLGIIPDLWEMRKSQPKSKKWEKTIDYFVDEIMNLGR
jgi:hypothetical protein